MTTEVQDKNIETWVEALRSGNYKQGRRRLFTEDGGYCCLGVAAVVVCDLTRDNEENDAYDKVKEALGLTYALGIYDDGSLSGANDIRGLTFDEIADIIESRPEGLFI